MDEVGGLVEYALEIEDLVVRYGDVTAVRGVTVRAKRGEHVTLLGPSGCGKTTTLRAVAGLEDPASGRILINGKPVFDGNKRVHVPTEKRGISMVFQNYAIWPHMTVFENVAYGLKLRNRPNQEIKERAQEALDMVDMGNLPARLATNLSGGQQQRVALARSFAFGPDILLFDEPLSNLDAKLRAHMRVELKELQRRLGITALYVTHDQEEALSMSDHVVVMNEGLIEQQADPVRIYFRPETEFVADFIGASNIMKGEVKEIDKKSGEVTVSLENGQEITAAEGSVSAAESDVGDQTGVTVKTVHVLVEEPDGTWGRNSWEATVQRRIFVGDFVQYVIDWFGFILRTRSPAIDLHEEGDRIKLRIEPEFAVVIAPSRASSYSRDDAEATSGSDSDAHAVDRTVSTK